MSVDVVVVAAVAVRFVAFVVVVEAVVVTTHVVAVAAVAVHFVAFVVVVDVAYVFVVVSPIAVDVVMSSTVSILLFKCL